MAPTTPTSAMSSLISEMVLGQFQCPFQFTHDSEYCSLKAVGTLGGLCPFGHAIMLVEDIVGHEGDLPGASARRPASPSFRKIPPYICTRYLINQCSSGHDQDHHSPKEDHHHLARCAFGFHPKLTDLIDLEQFNHKMASVIFAMGSALPDKNIPGLTVAEPVALPSVATSSKTVASKDQQCAICFQHVLASNRPFGIQEHCSHAFCAGCIIAWYEHGFSRRCPTCRTVSSRILVWSRMVTDTDEKGRLLELAGRAIKLDAVQQDYGTD